MPGRIKYLVIFLAVGFCVVVFAILGRSAHHLNDGYYTVQVQRGDETGSGSAFVFRGYIIKLVYTVGGVSGKVAEPAFKRAKFDREGRAELQTKGYVYYLQADLEK
jgi:hypothetical protein